MFTSFTDQKSLMFQCFCGVKDQRKDRTMKEIAVFGVKRYADGMQDTKLIRRQESTGEYEQGIELCSDLPTNDYDGFIFVDDDTGESYRYDLNKLLRQRKRVRNINYKELFADVRT